MAPATSGLISDDDAQWAEDQEYGLAPPPLRTQTGRNPTNEIKEWTLLVKLVTSGADNDVNIVPIHREIIKLLRVLEPDLSIKTKDGSIITCDTDFPTGASYKDKFNMKETKNQFTVGHTVYSIKTLDELKRHNDALLTLLGKSNVYIDVSASGSLNEILLGPLLGVHPDNTSKLRLQADMRKLIIVHVSWDAKLTELKKEANAKLPFLGSIPPFQLKTRRIRRKIDDVDHSAKTVAFICAAEHRPLWEALLSNASTANGYLNPLGRFYLLRRDDKSEDLRLALTWHNQIVNTMKAIVIRGIDNHIMDAHVLRPHDLESRPTLRDKIADNGFVTIVSTREKGKWIGITTDPAAAQQYVNTILSDLCKTLYDPVDETAPEAFLPDKTSRPLVTRQESSVRTQIFETQTKTWADLTKGMNTDDATTHTETNIARRPPRMVQFQSKVRFEDKNEIDNNTNISAPDSTGMTTITQDDLKAMEARIYGRNKQDMNSAISTAISAISGRTESQDTQVTFLSRMEERWEKQEEQINQHNVQMQSNMQTMKDMMVAMQQFVQSAHPLTQPPTPTPVPASNPTPRADSPPPAQQPDSEEDSFGDFDNSQEQQDADDNEDIHMEVYGSDDDFSPSSKRRSTRPKGQSPDAKRTLRSATTRGGSNRAVNGRPGRNDPGGRHTIRQNLNNRYEPLATSHDAQSPGGAD
jgi:hypothetical protein